MLKEWLSARETLFYLAPFPPPAGAIILTSSSSLFIYFSPAFPPILFPLCLIYRMESTTRPDFLFRLTSFSSTPQNELVGRLIVIIFTAFEIIHGKFLDPPRLLAQPLTRERIPLLFSAPSFSLHTGAGARRLLIVFISFALHGRVFSLLSRPRAFLRRTSNYFVAFLRLQTGRGILRSVITNESLARQSFSLWKERTPA